MNIRDLISYPPAYGIDLDSDEVEAKLAALNINPDNCTIADALNALRQMPPTARAKGAQLGNTNAKKDTTRTIKIMVRVTPAEHTALTNAAYGTNLAAWVRNLALSAAKQTKEN